MSYLYLKKALNVVSPHIATRLYILRNTVQRFDFKWWCIILDIVRISVSLFSCNLPISTLYFGHSHGVHLHASTTRLYNLSDSVQRFDLKWWCAILDTVRISVSLFSCNLPTLLRFRLFILSVHMVFIYMFLKHSYTIPTTLSRDLISSNDAQF